MELVEVENQSEEIPLNPEAIEIGKCLFSAANIN